MTDAIHLPHLRYNRPGEDDSYSSEPTPVPNSYRPPPPMHQQENAPESMVSPGMRERAYDHHRQASLMNSTLLSLSVDDVGTLPSLALDPPSPMSRPSESIMGTPSTVVQAENQPTALSRARLRRNEERQRNPSTKKASSSKKSPPIEEVYMDDNDDTSGNQDYVSTVEGETDTFFECLEDRSLANRARRTLHNDTRSSSHRTLLSSPDIKPVMPKPYGKNGGYQRRGLDDIHENIGSDEVVRVHESALHALQQLKEELVKANQRNDDLTREREHWKRTEQDLQKKVADLETTDQQKSIDLDRLKQDHERLKADNEATEKQRDQLAEEKRKLETQTRESARTIKELRHRTLAGDNRHKELKGQLDKLNKELERTLSVKGEMAAEFAQAQTERMELETEAENLRKELTEITRERDRFTSDGKRADEELRNERRKLQELRTSSDAEIGRLNASLRKANEALHRVRAELTPKVRSAVRNIATPSSGSRGGFAYGTNHNTSMNSTASSLAGSAMGPPATLDTAIADRLARLRDSAERAHLVRGHKRELARVKSERDTAIQKLENEHADNLKKARKQFETKRKSDLEQLTEKLTRQYESRLEEVEQEHRSHLSHVKKEYERNQEDLDESLEEALTRIARVSQDHEREKGRRHALERTVEDLHRKMKVQQKDLQAKHNGEVEKIKRNWEAEKEIMLGNLQRDCNVAFENRRRLINGNHKWASTPSARTFLRPSPTEGSHQTLRVDTNPTPHSVANPPLSTSAQQLQPQQQHSLQQRNNLGPSPLSMNSAVFFADSKNQQSVDAGGATSGATAYIMPSPTSEDSPSPIHDPVETIQTGVGSPSIVSKTYSDIDSVLRETEELVQSIL